MPRHNTLKEYINELHDVKDDVTELAPKVISIVSDYVLDNKENENKNLCELLYGVKEELTDIVIKNKIELGIDEYSQFLKNYLDNPIDTIINQCKKKEDIYGEYYSIQLFGLIMDKNIDFGKLYNDTKAVDDAVSGERNNYNEYIKNKKDSWKENQTLKARWFVNYFNNGKSILAETIDKNKGGFFENFFGKTSTQYKELSRRLSNINTDGPDKGDLDGLKNAALAYLGHKFKKGFFATEDISFDEEELNRMDATSQGRVHLCQCILEAIEKSEEAIESGLELSKFVPEEDIEFTDSDMFYGAWLESQKNKNASYQDGFKNDADDVEIKDNFIEIDNDESMEGYFAK